MNKLGFILNLSIAINAFQAFLVPEDDISDNKIEIDYELFTDLEEKWFEQDLDHFNIQDNRTFLIRYFEDNTFFKPGGPLLLEIGGEGEIVASNMQSGQSHLLAEKLRGKIVLVEHRYYGKSSPFENLTGENLIYLTVDQALEDLANFVYTLKRTTPELKHSKVAAFGCSYSGALATWFRYKFPHLIDAAWASSAPLRAVSDFYEYLEVASEVYANVSLRCYNTIRKGYNEAKKLLSTVVGENEVKAALEYWSCGNVTEKDAKEILSDMRYVIADHNISPSHGVESCELLDMCSNCTAFRKLVKLLMNKSSEVCYETDQEYPNDGLAWTYQTCTEFGFSVTTTSEHQPFNETLSVVDEDMESCVAFGEEFTIDLLQQGIERINRVYGSTDLQVTKVLSVHGAQDPWHKLGLYKQTSEEAPVILIPGTSHCADQTNYKDEPVQLTKAKYKARKIMEKWLQ